MQRMIIYTVRIRTTTTPILISVSTETNPRTSSDPGVLIIAGAVELSACNPTAGSGIVLFVGSSLAGAPSGEVEFEF